MTTTITPIVTHSFTERALKAELGRRRKPRNERGRMRSWVFGGMSKADIQAVLAGEVVEVQFKNRTEYVGLK